MKRYKIFLPILLIAVICSGIMTANTRSKARYYFMQGSLEAASQNMAEAYEYFKKAYTLDPDYADASFTYGNQRLFLRTDTMQSEQELDNSMKMMQKYVDVNPLDLYATQMYGYVTTALDTVEESIRVYNTTYEAMPSETQLLQVLADAYMRAMKGKEAIETLEKYEKIEGKSKDVSLKKITILLALQDTLGAVKEADDLIAVNPRDPYSRILKGNLYEVVGNKDSVVAVYREAERLAPSNGAVKMSLANYYKTTGDSIMLDKMIYEALLSEEFELEDKLGILGDYLQTLLDEEGNRTRGDHLFSVLQEQYPHEAQVLEMAARYAGAKQDYAGAREAIGYAIDMDPVNENYWLMLLSFDLMDKQYEAAVEDYEKAVQHLEPSVRLKNLYASAATMIEDTAKAEKILQGLLIDEYNHRNKPVAPDFDMAIGASPELADFRKGLDYDNLVWVSSLYCMIGDMYYKHGEKEKGFPQYEAALYLLPDNALALNNYAYFLSEEDMELEKAKKMSRRALDLSEDNATYIDTYAWILYKMGDYREAREYMQLAMDLAAQQGDDNEDYILHMEAIEKALEKEDNK